jgi:hypothetical protein
MHESRKREIGRLVESDMPQYPIETHFQKEVRKVGQIELDPEIVTWLTC